MNKGIHRGYIMVINHKGERKRVKVDNYNKSKMLNDDKMGLNDYRYEIAWDLSHGFTEANQAFEFIEKACNEPEDK